MPGRFAIGVDLGGTKIATGIADLDGAILARRIIPTEPSLGIDGVLRRITGSVREVMGEIGVTTQELEGIGICCPGPLNPETGVIVFAPNLGWRNVSVVSYMVEEFSVPTYLENDANAAALAEKWFGAGRDARNMLYVTVSTGIGGGLIVDGDIYRGRDYQAGEIGHTILDMNGPVCGCGQRGCIEALSSGTAITKRAQEVWDSQRPTLMRQLVHSREELTPRIIAQASERGDKEARAILHQAFLHLGTFLIGMFHVLNVDKVVIGGGVSKMGDLFFQSVRKVVQERMTDVPAKHTPIVPAETGDNVGILGAIGLVVRLVK